ncbi:MAG: SusE domain-containing protein [Bacteroidales bacterium]|nr:SusE domain-containing protein [Bacteroidales bacterium]MDD4031345.1 SusE domain-containing protein [Bacteroidales bacterium]MDD4436318.1 SusE domain-containing protein [Bacteroidales bacterium]
MKYTKYLTMLFASVLVLVSCDIQIEKAYLNPASGFEAPVLLSQSPVIINEDNNKTESVTFNWSGASFGPAVQIEYSLYATANSKTALIGTSFTNSLSVTKSDLNGLVANDLGVGVNATASITAYLVAKVYGTSVESVTSNSIAFNVTTFAAALRQLYLTGNYQGWTIEQAPEFWETDGGTNVYKILVDLEDGSDQYSYFKVTVARNWSDANWGYNFLTPSWYCPEQSDSNLSVDLTEGNIYLLTVNRGKMTIDKQLINKVGIIGAFDESGWSTDLDMVYDEVNNVWVSPAITFSGDKNFLIRLNESWDDKYGTNNEASTDVEGGVKLVKWGADLNVPSTGTYIMKLHGNRTPFVLLMEKQ